MQKFSPKGAWPTSRDL